MKKYTEADIKVVKWEDHARKNPEMYFGSESPSAIIIAEAIEYVAKILGAEETAIKYIDEWTYFCADIDWIFNSSVTLKSESEVFLSLRPFPEANSQNSYRCEALTSPFSSDIYLLKGENKILVKGELPSDSLIKAHQMALGSWERIVGFKYESNA